MKTSWIEKTKKQISEANKEGLSIKIVGDNSKSFYGNPIKEKIIVSTKDYKGIIDYQPSELTVVVKSGTKITDLEKHLEKNNQFFNFEPPRFCKELKTQKKILKSGTIGGMVATGLSGPGRFYYGGCRDSVLGVTLLNYKGQLLRFGGTVIKNVAGYDISRLQVGAFGNLGLLLDVCLRVYPKPKNEITFFLPVNYEKLIFVLTNFYKNKFPFSASYWSNFGEDNYFRKDHLYLRISGSHYGVRNAEKIISREVNQFEVLDNYSSINLWEKIRDQTINFFSEDLKSDEIIWRVSIPPGIKFNVFEKNTQIIEWGGALRWIKSNHDPYWVRMVVTKAGGHATIYKASDNTKLKYGCFTPLPSVLKDLHCKLKKEIDPNHIFNPGRLYDYL